MKYTCPACGYRTFGEPIGSYEICSICGWEDDISQLKFPKSVGANRVNLIQAQKNFASMGYSTKNILLRLFRKRIDGYQKDSEWRMLNESDGIEKELPYGEKYPKDPTDLCYWRS